MSDFILSRQQRFFILAQTLANFNSIPNTAGTGTPPLPVRTIKFQATNKVGLLTRRDKTGTRGVVQGTSGRGMSSWTMEGSLTTGGAAGVLPDLDPFWSSMFCKTATGTVVATTSVTYSLAENLQFFAMYDYGTSMAGAATDARITYACTPSQVVLNVNQDVAEFTASGDAKWTLRSKGFASFNTDQKGGLTTFVAEPSSPTYKGNLVQGFLGVATLNGVVLSDHIVSAQITYRTGADVIKNTFGTLTPTSAEADERNIGVSLSVYDDTGTDIETLKEMSESKTPINITFQIGSTAGSIVTLNLINVILGDCDVDKNSARRSIANFAEGRAYGTTPLTADELTMVLT